VKPYVLRYWETEFTILRPGKTRSKHRLYRGRTSRRCSRSAACSTPSATRSKARSAASATAPPAPEEPAEALAAVRNELLDLCRLLDRDPPPPLKIGD
jgi:hypothetical protein